MSINPKQLSQEIKPVGICVAINGNKAMVRYRKEASKMWAASERWELPYASIMNDNASHSLSITLNGATYDNLFTYTASTRLQFIERLNEWFRANNSNYSAELVEPNTDLPATDTSDTKIGTNTFKNRIIINAKFTANAWNTISISGIGAPTRAIGKHIKEVDNYYKNNGFLASIIAGAGCCRAKLYDFINQNQLAPTGPMTSIDSGPVSSIPYAFLPVKKVDFEDNSNCQFLRDNFSTYDDYLESWMTKFPCSSGGAITEFPSGKENTYKLANCTFIDNTITSGTRIKPLYPAANHAASINIDAPGLEAGNWWLPSPAEMVQMMRDITYHSSFFGANPDIVNTVLNKMFAFDNANWDMLSPASASRWTPCRCNKDNIYGFYGAFGTLRAVQPYQNWTASPITIYEF